MSIHGAPAAGAVEDARNLRVVIIAAQWHAEVMNGLLQGAQRALDDSGVTHVTVLRVPGAFELPVAASRVAHSGADAIVALGVVIRGGTPHFEYVCAAATDGLTQVSVSSGIPIGFGVLTCDNDRQALDRAGLEGSREDKGYEATQAALMTVVGLRDYPRAQRPTGTAAYR
jgi:6,7-dimethyl-8-ribityllumazine synthase